jgi:hypothetical protein
LCDLSDARDLGARNREEDTLDMGLIFLGLHLSPSIFHKDQHWSFRHQSNVYREPKFSCLKSSLSRNRKVNHRLTPGLLGFHENLRQLHKQKSP